MTDNDKTVAVPVELLRRAADRIDESIPDPQLERDLRALIPKPKPRLVAVTQEQYEHGYDSTEWASQPDLLTVLDGVIDGLKARGWLGDLGVQNARTDLRRALGVPNAE